MIMQKKGANPKLAILDEVQPHRHQVIKTAGRQGGKKTAMAKLTESVFPVKPLIYPPAEPLTPDQRRANYVRQNGSDRLTPAQLRRLHKKDHTRPAPPVKQHFSRIDNQRRETGRVGAKRFGPQMTIKGLNELLFRSRTTVKGMNLGQTEAGQRGRIAARTGHGRKRTHRGSRRNG
jgi:hypothetical protein